MIQGSLPLFYCILTGGLLPEFTDQPLAGWSGRRGGDGKLSAHIAWQPEQNRINTLPVRKVSGTWQTPVEHFVHEQGNSMHAQTLL